jgi:hypothetical protein
MLDVVVVVVFGKMVPGKEEFHETIRYFNRKLQLTGNHSLLVLA